MRPDEPRPMIRAYPSERCVQTAMAIQTPPPSMLWCWPEAWAEIDGLRSVLESFARVDVLAPSQEELVELLPKYEILVPRLSHEVRESMIASCQALRLIGTPSTGSDHIAVDAAASQGVPTVTLKQDPAFLASLPATAELAWLLLLACFRRLREATAQTRDGGWDAQAVRGNELMGQTLGIVGYGRLGKMMGRFARAFRMNVLATDPGTTIEDCGVQQVSLDELLAASDAITMHVHLDESTRGLIGPDAFTRMKPGVVLVNTSRGGVLDETALLRALEHGRVAAAGLDVIQGERDPDRRDRPLLRYAVEHPNLIVTPHIGGCTVESQSKAFLRFAELLRTAWDARFGTDASCGLETR